MSYLLQSSPSVPTWLAVLGVVLAPSLALFGVWLTRKRRSTVKAEDNKLGAEAQYQLVQTLASLSLQLKTTNLELSETIEDSTQKARELRELHTMQIEFLQAQVDIKTEDVHEARQAEQRVRGRFHASQNEIQRCIFKIRDYEELLRHCEPKAEFVPFDFTPYKDIMEGHSKDAAV